MLSPRTRVEHVLQILQSGLHSVLCLDLQSTVNETVPGKRSLNTVVDEMGAFQNNDIAESGQNVSKERSLYTHPKNL